MKTIRLLIALLAVSPFVFGQVPSGDVTVSHYDAAFCNQFSNLGIPGACQQNVFVAVSNQDPRTVDSVKVTIRFSHMGITTEKTERVEVNQNGHAFAFFNISDIKIISVIVSPLSVLGETTTIQP